MGGNATKQFGTQRIPRADHKQIKALINCKPECMTTFEFDQGTYGDIDVVCTEPG